MEDGERVSHTSWDLLPTAIQLHILSLVPPNDRALAGRLMCKRVAASASDVELCTASLSQPLPPHAVPWAMEVAQEQVRQLPFGKKLQMLSAAASSGSELNLEVALALLKPSTFSEVLHLRPHCWSKGLQCPDPGAVAIKAGHPQLLGWLLQHCPASLLTPDRVLEAAAIHCDLAGLQAAWEAIQTSRPEASLRKSVLNAAAASTTPDAVAKMQWLMEAAPITCRLTESTTMAAARSGDLGRLRWLRGRGCQMRQQSVLFSALRHADLAVAQWLVDEAGCELPARADPGWEPLLRVATCCPVDGVAKLQWLQQRGAPPLDAAGSSTADDLAIEALYAGQVEVVRYLMSACGAGATLQSDPDTWQRAAAMSGSIPMMEVLRQAGLMFTCDAYDCAAMAGDLAMVQWLTREAGVSEAGVPMRGVLPLIQHWPERRTVGNRSLLQAVQWVLEEAERRGRGAAGTGEQSAGVRLDTANSYMGLNAVSVTVKRSDMALVRYLTEHKSAPKPRGGMARELLSGAAEAGCEALIEWLAQQPRCLEGPFTGCLYTVAAQNGDRATLVALRRLGVPWGKADSLAEAVRRRCVMPALRWLRDQGAPVGSAKEVEVVAAAAEQSLSGGQMEAAGWLRRVAVEAAAAAPGEA